MKKFMITLLKHNTEEEERTLETLEGQKWIRKGKTFIERLKNLKTLPRLREATRRDILYSEEI